MKSLINRVSTAVIIVSLLASSVSGQKTSAPPQVTIPDTFRGEDSTTLTNQPSIGDLKWFDIFSRSYSVNTDSLYLADQKSEKAAYIVPYIGAKGIMPELGSKDRINYAPCFYHGSASLVKYIAETYGIKILLTAIASFNQEQEMLEKLTGKKMETLKQEWQTKLNTIK